MALSERIQITKIDAARRNLESAITMYFNCDDPIPIHTLAAASNEVLFGICTKRGIKSFLKSNPLIRPDKYKEVMGVIKAPENFFKHGKNDSLSTIIFNPACTELFMLDACIMYHALSVNWLPLPKLFISWMVCVRPNLFDLASFNEEIGPIRRAYRSSERSKFYSDFLEVAHISTGKEAMA